MGAQGHGGPPSGYPSTASITVFTLLNARRSSRRPIAPTKMETVGFEPTPQRKRRDRDEARIEGARAGMRTASNDMRASMTPPTELGHAGPRSAFVEASG